MDARKFLEIIHFSEKLKDVTRHAYTSGGRHESVAEHSWRLCLMAFFLRDEFPDADMDKVMRMCMLHDMGEIFTGDIPAFLKSQAHAHEEDTLLYAWVDTLPASYCGEMRALYDEMNALETIEAKIYKALDKIEAVVQHNESDISTWLPLEYDLNRSYAFDAVAFSPYLTQLRQLIREETDEKIRAAGEQAE